jgi:rhodanese-related sulfurtransferase
MPRRDGVRVYYRLAGADVAGLYAQLQQVGRRHLADVDAARTAYLGPEDTEQLTRDELLARIKSGSAVVIDVRPAEEWAAGHIPGALSVPLDDLMNRLDELRAAEAGLPGEGSRPRRTSAARGRVNEFNETVLVLVAADRDDQVVRGSDHAVAERHSPEAICADLLSICVPHGAEEST